MNDSQTPADLSAGDEAVGVVDTDAPELEQDSAAAPESEDAPAESAETDESEEATSRSKKRREERKREREKAIARAAENEAKAATFASELDKIRKAGESLRPPKEEDFANYNDYIAATAVYSARRANADDRQEALSQQQQEAERAAQIAQRQAAEEAKAMFTEAAAEARSRYADFDAVVFDKTAPIASHVVEAIMHADAPADMAYAIAKDRDLAGKLSAMTPLEAALQIGRIEAAMSVPRPRIETKAPAPINPVRPKAAATPDPAKMTPEEYNRWREAGGTFTL